MTPGELFLRLANLSIAASWLIFAVFAVRLVLRRAPKGLICLLWALVALRLVCPISVESPTSLVPSRETLPVDQLYSPVPTPADLTGSVPIDTGIPALEGSGPDRLRLPGTPAAVFVGSEALGILWLLGLAALLGYALVSFLRLRRRVATAVLTEPGVKRSEFIDTPFVLGLLRPTVLLPYSLGEADLPYVLAHERAHLARRDHWWKPLGFLILAIHWFNPLVWLSYVLFCRDLEAACDERVCRDLDQEARRAYAGALLDCSVRRRRVAPCPLAFGETGVKNRVKSVMNYKKPAFWLVLLAVLALIAAGVFFLTDPVRRADGTAPFGKTWHVELVRESPYRNSTDVGVLQPDLTLSLEGGAFYGEVGGYIGHFRETDLDRTWFLDLFLGPDMPDWQSIGESLYKQNAAAWRLTPGGSAPEDNLALLLLQEDGTLYLVRGWFDTEGLTDPLSDDSTAQTVCLLTEPEDRTVALWSGQDLILVLDGHEHFYTRQASNHLPAPGDLIAEAVDQADGTNWQIYALDTAPDLDRVLLISDAGDRCLGLRSDTPADPPREDTDLTVLIDLQHIEDTPETSLDAGEHIRANQDVYDGLRVKGIPALDLCARELMEGSPSPLRADILWRLCQDIVADLGETMPVAEVEWVDPDSVTGRDWFDVTGRHWCQLLDDLGANKFQQTYPGGWAVLQALGGPDSFRGGVTLYDAPTPETDIPCPGRAVSLPYAKGWDLRQILARLPEATDDYAANRLPDFTYDGSLYLQSAPATVYYFSTADKVLYWDHYFSPLPPSAVEWFRSLE